MERKNVIIAMAIIAIILITATGIAMIFITAEEQHAVVQSVAWEREIQIQRYKWVDESGWHMPSGAKLRWISSEVHHYDTENYTDYDGERRSRQKPVYHTKYYYEIERWRYERSVVTSGDSLNVHWGEVALEPKEREDRRREKYSINVHTDDSTCETFQIGFDEWQKVRIGNSVKVKRYVSGIYAYIGLLE